MNSTQFVDLYIVCKSLLLHPVPWQLHLQEHCLYINNYSLKHLLKFSIQIIITFGGHFDIMTHCYSFCDWLYVYQCTFKSFQSSFTGFFKTYWSMQLNTSWSSSIISDLLLLDHLFFNFVLLVTQCMHFLISFEFLLPTYQKYTIGLIQL